MVKEKVGLKSLSAERCPECDGLSLVHDPVNAEIVCTSCGFVVIQNKWIEDLSGEPLPQNNTQKG